MTRARVRRPTCAARPAAWKASPRTYTPPWKYRTTWRGSTPSTVISAAGTPPSVVAVTVTSAGSGCAGINSRSSRRCSLTSMPTGKADCRRIASRFSRCSALIEDLLIGWNSPGSAPRRARPCRNNAEIPCREADHYQACRQAGEEAPPDHGDSRRDLGHRRSSWSWPLETAALSTSKGSPERTVRVLGHWSWERHLLVIVIGCAPGTCHQGERL